LLVVACQLVATAAEDRLSLPAATPNICFE